MILTDLIDFIIIFIYDSRMSYTPRETTYLEQIKFF